jgi:flagellar basal body rod protein FlgG
MAHISLFATNSLKAIDNWMKTCQTNLTGVARNSFKETDLFYGGGPTSIIVAPQMLTAGKMIAEQALTTDNTRLNWTQGNLVSSPQDTHFAIQGEGFFLVQEQGPAGSFPASTLIINNPAPPPATITDAQSISDINTYNISSGTTFFNQGKVFLTRDGEFHFGELPGDATVPPRQVLMDAYGNLVLGARGNGGTGFGPISVSDFYRPSTQNATNFRERPSIVSPTVQKDTLAFSKFGSTYFEFMGGVAVTANMILDGSQNILSQGETILSEKQLESSNVDIAMNVTEMAALGKIYNGFVQLIKVYNSSLDEVLGFIR